MSITTKLTASLAGTCLLLLTTVFSSGAFAIGIPGSVVPPSGEPFMFNSVKVRANNGKWSITSNTGNDPFQLWDGSTLYNGTGSKYTLNVDFNKNTGAFIGGTLEISGQVAALGINTKTTLVTADITAYDFDALYNNKLIGFATDNIDCYAGLGFTCTTSESIWITLASAYGGDPTARFKNTGTAITTLPLPAAAWLFGSGLVFLAATGRRRSDKHQKI